MAMALVGLLLATGCFTGADVTAGHAVAELVVIVEAWLQAASSEKFAEPRGARPEHRDVFCDRMIRRIFTGLHDDEVDRTHGDPRS